MAPSLARRIAARVLPAPVKAAIHDLARKREFDAAARRGMVPPPQLWAMVGSATEFVEGGRSFFEYLVEHGRLTPQSAVLDIGCGLGKHAIHFADYLVPPGRYEGFDVEPLGIDWCNRAIAKRYPNMGFRHVAIQNDMYSPGATLQASQFTFPYPDATFDLAFLGSVFTHMFRDDVHRYIAEIGRVLKPGGICVATAYLLNDQKRKGIAAGASAFTFAIPHQNSWIERPNPPEGAVAHEESTILGMLEAEGLKLAEPIRYGCWDYEKQQDQDFVIFTRP